MTPEYILRRSLCRKPHCFSAHVPGEGYVNRGDIAGPMYEEYIRQYVQVATQELENLTHAPKYAERGYTDPKRGILFANWNHFPSEVTDILERAGWAIEWADEWDQCEACHGAFRTSPDGYSWTPAGTYIEGSHRDRNGASWHYAEITGSLCLDCLQEEAESARESEREEEGEGDHV